MGMATAMSVMCASNGSGGCNSSSLLVGGCGGNWRGSSVKAVAAVTIAVTVITIVGAAEL